MRRSVLILTMLMSGLMRSSALQAGVYNLDPPRKYPSDLIVTHVPQPLEPVIAYIDELIGVRDTPLTLQNPAPPGSLRESYEKQLAALEVKQQQGLLEAADEVNLGACLIRLGRYSKAQEVLEASLRRQPLDEPFRCLLQLNLAAVYQEDDSQLLRGIDMQREALAAWPALLRGWSRAESEWFRQVEKYVLTLMELRNRELILQGGRPPRQQPSFYLLFPRDERDLTRRVQFVGGSGEYEAGGIAWKQWERLPADAEQVVLQLLLWRPADVRLLWLYGELLNARGKVDWAYFLFRIKIRENNQWRNRELDAHLRILGAADSIYRVLWTDNTGSGENRRNQAKLLWCLAPRGTSASGVGAAVNEIGGFVASTYGGMEQTRFTPQTPTLPPASAPAGSSPLPDWRHLTVSFVAGMVVAVLGLLQWQQWRRQRAWIVDRGS